MVRDKYLTFLYLPDSNSPPWTLRVRRSFVWALVATVLVAIGASGWAVLRYSSRLKDAYLVSTLQAQNAELRSELGSLAGELGTLRRQVSQNFDFQKKARLLANLDDLSDDVTEVGVGGPEIAYVHPVGHLDKETRERIVSARGDLEKLLRQARLQKTNYEEIIERLETANEELRATPSLRPVNVGFVSSRYGWRMDPISGRRTVHRGVDFSARMGTPVYATADGAITFSGVWETYGNVVEVSHGRGFVTRYAHLQQRLVHRGQRVRRGDVIGRVGSTGRSTFAHLHYEIEREGSRLDPMRYVLVD